jgi:hypothetical protein
MSLGVLAGRASTAQADGVPPAHVQFAQTMLLAEGQEWLGHRDAFLQWPGADRAALLQYLASEEATKEDKTLGLVLRTRMEQPTGVADYELNLAKDLNQPMIGRSGRPVYGYYGPRVSSENYGLIVEHVWKRTDLPEQLRVAYVGYLANRVQEVDSLLVLLERDADLSATLALAFSTVPGAGDDPRVPAALLGAYQQARTEYAESSDAAQRIMTFTAWLGTPLARDAVLQMHAFEQTLMLQQGRTPWNDQGEANEAHKAAIRATRLLSNEPFVDGAQRAQALALAKEQERDAWTRLSEVLLWKSFYDAYDKLRDLGVPVDNPPPQ